MQFLFASGQVSVFVISLSQVSVFVCNLITNASNSCNFCLHLVRFLFLAISANSV